ncbi:CbtB domain-containing protein [Actinophytocola sp.]|uniref:CbtB domain-containing protein n=1 Tax=Actinophytocola sp. TaxID=1872138 RepID=UPI002ED39B27
MSHAVSAPTPLHVPAIPIRQILPWAVFAGLLFGLVMYFVSTEQGALSMFDGMSVHELVHDGRHLLGFPCH